ncbi:hypothetical protein ALC62_06452 [Cyphomyrmex costatus]|uniref:Uncharacterized protein n=1 Tax=Cyphomyrmex costatus TaxID=456900 RepID=A0A195CPJ1_9HYME|nr:hypothetical protein ALC62_06452 [Cyphomyrmex costatus]
MVAGALLPPYGGLTANVSAPYMAATFDMLFMNHFIYSRNSLEWSDTTIKNQVALDGPMEAVNRLYVRFAGSKFKARHATGSVSTRVNSPGKIESGHGPVNTAVITVRQQRTSGAAAATATNDHSLIRPNERRRRCGQAIKSEMGEAIDKYIKADRNARLIETKEEGRPTDRPAGRPIVVGTRRDSLWRAHEILLLIYVESTREVHRACTMQMIPRYGLFISIDPYEINIPITRYEAILPVEFPSALRAVCTSDGLGGLDGGCDYDRRRGLCRNTDE